MAEITAALVKELRELTGLGMMECKKALEESGGDIKKAEELLRIKSGAKASKAASRVAAEGAIGAWRSPDGKLGAMVEVNSETDFVARNPEFAAFASALAELVAKVGPRDVAALSALKLGGKTVEGTREARAKESGKPPEIVAKMVEGGINKFLAEITLLGQPFVKDDKLTVEKMLAAKNARVRGYRFLVVGEGIEKKGSDFSAEVAAMTKTAA